MKKKTKQIIQNAVFFLKYFKYTLTCLLMSDKDLVYHLGSRIDGNSHVFVTNIYSNGINDFFLLNQRGKHNVN